MKLLLITKKPKTKPCPHCGKQISVKAIRCKWCGRWVSKVKQSKSIKFTNNI